MGNSGRRRDRDGVPVGPVVLRVHWLDEQGLCFVDQCDESGFRRFCVGVNSGSQLADLASFALCVSQRRGGVSQFAQDRPEAVHVDCSFWRLADRG